MIRTVVLRAGAATPALLALLALAALPACPVPQPVAEYPATGVVAPPQILMDSLKPIDTIVYVSTGCASPPDYLLSANLVYTDLSKGITARWFVDYDTTPQNWVVRQQENVPVDSTAPDPTLRTVTPYVFQAYGWTPSAAGSLHVVDLVVSNGFAKEPPDAPTYTARPFRTPDAQFQTQTYRWVFSYVATGGTCGYP